MPPDQPEPLVLHANAVAVRGRGVLIRGASGSGKSSLTLQLMAMGAVLIADDRVVLTERDGDLWMSAPGPIKGLIEARGIGILHAETQDMAPLVAVVDLDAAEDARLPPQRSTILLDRAVPLLHNCASPAFPAGLVQYLKGGRKE